MAKKKTIKKIKRKKVSKSKSKSTKVKKTKKKVNVGAIVLTIIIIALIGVGVYFYFSTPKNLQTKTTRSDVLAVVGTEKITQQDVDEYKKVLPQYMRNLVTTAQLLQDLINQKLILLDAKDKGISLTDEDFNQSFTQFLQMQNLTMDKFKDQLNSVGIEYDAFLKFLRKIFLTQKYMDEFVYKQLNVSEKEMKDFYEQNKFFFGNKTYDEVKGVINQTLLQMKAKRFLEQYLNDLKGKYNVKVMKPYNYELCLLNMKDMHKVFLYSDDNCKPCDEMKNALKQANVTNYEEFNKDSDVAKCFDDVLKNFGYAMPALICKDGSYTLSKDPQKLKEFVESCK